MRILEHTNSARVRNAAALALVDLRAHDAKDALIDLLQRPGTRGARGTLLYALQQLGENVPLPILTEIIIDDSYEAREEALAFIISSHIECSAEEFARSRVRLEAAASSADTDRLNAIHRALEYLWSKTQM
jgi:HEAT repeat protein